MMRWSHGAWGSGDWTLMVLMMLLAVVAVSLARSGRPRIPAAPSATPGADPLLAERFARGEIDADQYARSRAVLHPSVPAASAK